MTVLGIGRRPRASAGWVRGPSTKPSSTRSAYLVPSAEFATPGLGVLVIDDPECLKVKVKAQTCTAHGPLRGAPECFSPHSFPNAKLALDWE